MAGRPANYSMKIALIVPTYNAARHWPALLDGIRMQNLVPDQVIFIDSSSTDGTAILARAAGFEVIQIDRDEFRHGRSRQAAALRAPHADILIYLTQDAIPQRTDSFRRLAAAFRDPAIGAAFGRQLPHAHASAIEAHARFFNYPAISQVRSWESRTVLGFKSIFFSNSFGAYRREALTSVGGFSPNATFGEDTLAAALLHRAGWKTAYVADALAVHSHTYSLPAEARRYFEIGAFHRREHWLIEQFGKTGTEGRRFVVSQLRYLMRHNPLQIPLALVRTVAKLFAYQAGLRGGGLAHWLKYRSIANAGYWMAPRGR